MNGDEDVPAGGLEGWLAAIVQSSQDAIIGKSLSGTILTWNGGAERLYGWSADEAVGQSISLLVPEGQRAFEDDLFRRIASGEQLQRVVVQRRHKSGLMVEVSLSMSPIMGPTGTVIGVASSTRDAGEGRRAEENRQRILDAAPDAMVCVDDTGAISFVNARAATLFQYRRDELIGRPVELLIAEHVREEHSWERARFLAGDYPRPMVTSQQLYGRRRDGSIFPADIGLSGLEIPGESLLIEAVRDVSERFEIEAALRESEARFRQLATNLEVGVSLRQFEPSEFLYVSPGYRAILGLAPDAEIPSPLEIGAMVHPDDRERVWAAFSRKASESGVVSAEHRVLTPAGEVRWVRSTSSPVSVNGVVTRAAGTLEDISARKEAEEAMLAAQREGEAANSAKSEFLSRMSHELRTPLNAVLGFAQLLELEILTDSQRSAVSHILRGGRHLLEMINDVLDISRIETDQLELSMESVSMSDVLADTIGLMRPTAVNAQVEIRYVPAAVDDEVHVRADRRRLRQVILNLLSNAIKYNVRGGSVEVEYQVVDDAHVRLRVSDTGIGIRSADLCRLFVPFDRFGDRTSEIEGTGIGLALSQRLVSIMGGRMEVESELAVGSTFAVILPSAESSPPRLVGRRALPTQDIAHAVPASTLLYIEDNMSNVRLIERILERRPGWTMVHAGLGGLGLELVEAARPTLVLLDLHLPDMDGVDVLRTLRADPRTADLPVVVVSADANLHQISRLHSAGAEHYLTKPLDVAEVLRVLDLHAGEPDAVLPPPPPSKNKVLYIEDDEGNIRLVQRIVQLRPDLELVIAGTGEEGLRVAGDAAFSLILLDRRLPDMPGNDVLRRLKTMPAAQTPVVMLSGDSGREHVEEMLDLGAVEYLAKPFDLNDLLAILDRFCATAG